MSDPRPAPADVAFASMTDLAAAIRRRQVSSREVLDVLAARIDRYNPALNAVVAMDLDGAREAAARADAATASGGALGPLHGVPMTVKDVFETAGLVTTCGDRRLRDYVPTTDAEVVARIRRAGAIVIGKTNTPEHTADWQTSNEVYGRTANPWDLARTPGGSSGGAAAAVAAGLSPVELGSDIGGSIRIPAHCCGIYGLKPSWGVVPQRGHIPGPPGSLVERDVNVIGPLARSVGDLAAMLDVLAGPLAEEAVAWRLDLPAPEPGAHRQAGVHGLRLGLVTGDPAVPVAADVRDGITAFGARLAGAGALVEPCSLPVPLAESITLWLDLALSPVGADLPDEVIAALAGTGPAELASDTLVRWLQALTLSHRDWLRAHQRRQEACRRWAEAFARFDAVLAPVMPTAAFPHDTDRPLAERTLDVDGQPLHHAVLAAWCGAVGVALLPAVVLPVGRTPEGLPVGVQVIGPYLHDRRLLALADRLDAVAGDPAIPPGYADPSGTR